MGLPNGADIKILINTGTEAVPVYELIASQRDATINRTSETIDVSSKDSRWRRVIPGRPSWSISMDALYVPEDAGYQALVDSWENGTMIFVRREEEDVDVEQGAGIVTDLSLAAPDQDGATVSVTIEGDDQWLPIGS